MRDRQLARDILGVLLCVAACGSPTAPEKSVEAHILAFTGAGAVNCGRLARTASDEEMQAGLTCALDAAARGAAFSVARQYQGIDSQVFQGLLAKAGGAVYRFSYDSAPCGNERQCDDRFTTEPCNAPRLIKQPYGTAFSCAP